MWCQDNRMSLLVAPRCSTIQLVTPVSGQTFYCQVLSEALGCAASLLSKQGAGKD